MGKLHELLAVEADRRNAAEATLAETKVEFTKRTAHYEGMSRSYEPLQEDGHGFEPEEVTVANTVPARLKQTREALEKYLDVVVAKEATNATASADIVIAGETVAKDVPSTALLALEKRIAQLRDTLQQTPTLDLKTRWEPDAHQDDVYRSPEVRKHRTEKQEDFTVVVPATEQHPAQIAQVTKDVRVGTWTQVNFSGCISSADKAAMLQRCDDLLTAVKKARQRANMTEVIDKPIARTLLAHVLG